MSRLQRTIRQTFTGLWRNPEFMKLWASLTVTSFGAQITNLALPLTAAVLLHATPWQMGVLVALETLPFALVSLHAGVLIDRVKQAADRHRGRPRAGCRAARDSAGGVVRRAVDGNPVRRRVRLRRAERRRRRRVPGAARADRRAQAPGGGERQGDPRRDVVGADRPGARRRADPAPDRAFRDRHRRLRILRLGADAAPHPRAAGRRAPGAERVGDGRDQGRPEARLEQPDAARARVGSRAVADPAPHAGRGADPVRDPRPRSLAGRDRHRLRFRRRGVRAGGRRSRNGFPRASASGRSSGTDCS